MAADTAGVAWVAGTPVLPGGTEEAVIRAALVRMALVLLGTTLAVAGTVAVVIGTAVAGTAAVVIGTAVAGTAAVVTGMAVTGMAGVAAGIMVVTVAAGELAPR
jgi:hypothetical protein